MARPVGRVCDQDDQQSVRFADRSSAFSTSTRISTASSTELGLLDVLVGLLPDARAEPDSHFFDDLGANSMTMAQFCARVRKNPDLPDFSIRDVYANPSVTALARSVVDVEDPPAGPDLEPPVTPGSSRAVVLTGIAQAAFFTGYAYLLLLATITAYAWATTGTHWLETYLRAVIAGGALLLVTCLFPVLVKWVLIGRWTPRRIALWSPGYLRFWVVKSLLHASPMILFVGSPLYPLYLRTLGARIGPGAAIFSRHVPVATDLLTVGAGAVVRKDTFFLGYRAQAGEIVIGSVSIGAGAFVGEKVVLDVDTGIGDQAQLGHSSSLRAGERVPSGERYHGAPAEPTTVDYRRVPELGGGGPRRFLIGLASVLQTLLVSVPLGIAGLYLLLEAAPKLIGTAAAQELENLPPWWEALTVSVGGVALVGTLGLGLIWTVPKILGRLIKPGVVYPLYGFHHSVHRMIQLATNIKVYTWLFGDSSFIVGYLRRLGYTMTDVEQTGSNFGTEVQHETPYQVDVGRGTMVADGLSIVNADFSSTAFRVAPVVLGANSFLGNNIAYPSGARIGSNCLLATKVMVPLDGPVRSGVGLLGAPAFEIPRTVDRDAAFDHLRSGTALRRALRSKDRVNLRSMALMTFARTVDLFLIAMAGFVLFDFGEGPWGQLLILAYAPAALVIQTGFWIGVERVLLRRGPLQPQLRSIYDPYFWWHERLWKVPDRYLALFNGTPFKALVWRLLGVRIGARVFDDGAYITERTLTAIGDDCVLNVNTKLQCHSQEDGTFKSDRTTLGAGVTLGVGAFIHYGVRIGDGAVIDADAFVMKGEEVPARARWGGNPAGSATANRADPLRPTPLDPTPAITGGQP